MQTHTIIPARFNGPPASGNGGYACGVLAAYIDGPARIRLHVPPPLDTALRVSKLASGGAQLFAGDTLIGSGEPALLELDVPKAPTEAASIAAMQAFPDQSGHAFPTCFVCGPKRAQRDGLALHPSPVPDRAPLWACLWHPAADLLDERGDVRAEILWSALDCPGYFAVLGDSLRPAVLGELLGELRVSVAGDQPLVVFSWPLGEDGRKFYAATAIARTDGEIVACSKSTWIALRE